MESGVGTGPGNEAGVKGEDGKGLDVVDQMLAALARYDTDGIRALSHPGLRRWLSVTEVEDDLETLLTTVERERTTVADATFTLRRRIDTVEGAVLLLAVDGTTTGGAAFHIPVCLVLTIRDGLVMRIDEFANLDGARALLREMFA